MQMRVFGRPLSKYMLKLNNEFHPPLDLSWGISFRHLRIVSSFLRRFFASYIAQQIVIIIWGFSGKRVSRRESEVSECEGAAWIKPQWAENDNAAVAGRKMARTTTTWLLLLASIFTRQQWSIGTLYSNECDKSVFLGDSCANFSRIYDSRVRQNITRKGRNTYLYCTTEMNVCHEEGAPAAAAAEPTECHLAYWWIGL